MNRYTARQLANMPVDELMRLPSEWQVVEMADGDVLTYDRITKLSVILWYPFKFFPDVPILKEHHMNEERVSSKSLVRCLNRVIWHIHSYLNEQVDTELLARYAIEATNILYNMTTIKLSPYVTTLSIFEVAEIYNDPLIREANTNVEPTTYGIEHIAYGKAKEALLDPTKFRGNSVVEGLRSGTQKMEQMLQAFAPRGFPTDINSTIFAEPILVGYVDGIWDLYGNMIESRSGTKALLYNKELLRVTEYFNRKSQLIAQYLMNLHHTDCGADYVDYPVLKATLKSMAGKYYLKEDGTRGWLRGNETHLIGKSIKMRSVLACVHPDPQGICAICYGRLSYNIPKGTNIGWVSAVVMGDAITSSVLSTKHTDATSAVEQYILAGTEAKYMKKGKVEETLYLQPEVAKLGYRLLIQKSEAQSLADILMIKDLSAYPAEAASNLTKIGLIRTVDGQDQGDILTVSLYNRKASLSTDLLRHVKKVGWSPDNRDNIVINLEGFEPSLPFLTLPFKHVNTYEFMKRVQSFLHSGSDTEGSRLSSDKIGFTGKTFLKNYRDPIDAVVAFNALVNEKIQLNLAHSECLVYAMMIRSAQLRDYRLPIPGISGTFEKYNRLMQNRSLAGAMAFEKQHEPLNNPASFLNKQRNDHPYDLAVMGGKLH
jgi:hypothetical protein